MFCKPSLIVTGWRLCPLGSAGAEDNPLFCYNLQYPVLNRQTPHNPQQPNIQVLIIRSYRCRQRLRWATINFCMIHHLPDFKR
jgi:hypothetical protein